jgi:hypothetical protein
MGKNYFFEKNVLSKGTMAYPWRFGERTESKRTKKSYKAEAKIKDPDAPTTDREAANAVTAKRLFL